MNELLLAIQRHFSKGVIEYAKHLQEMDRMKREHEERLNYLKWKHKRSLDTQAKEK